ncbi:ComF family protein [Maritimibacter sp. DP1N21-5]|uniref:ComF family protein n=1 Tax=Maritimibacter sp. DP1N21-5 TaxID=2836867 RepID=UPI001C448225|nr:double zinc ribbon domain-containing protein [Maritimibacter sp. DP1N21-5]MBV7411050.1 ComF family protein [Maritimibacter sp. DP1N21-5]
MQSLAGRVAGWLIDAVYPAQCASCGEPVNDDGGLCAACWRETHFVTGHACDLCGAPLVGEGDGQTDCCDDCLTIARPWDHGRTALLYKGNGRRLVLSLKHADRPDIAIPAARWIARAAAPVLTDEMIIVPVPAHWRRLLKRRYNQAAELARAMGRSSGLKVETRALVRVKGGDTQEGKSFDQRFAYLEGAIRPHPKFGSALSSRDVLLVDDVMTSGATLAAATEAARLAGAKQVCIATLARVVRDA